MGFPDVLVVLDYGLRDLVDLSAKCDVAGLTCRMCQTLRFALDDKIATGVAHDPIGPVMGVPSDAIRSLLEDRGRAILVSHSQHLADVGLERRAESISKVGNLDQVVVQACAEPAQQEVRDRAVQPIWVLRV
ncbi:hypothetical protein D3C87_1623740 [compost metagenome]